MQQFFEWNVGDIFHSEKAKNRIILKHGSEHDTHILEVEDPAFEKELMARNPEFSSIKKPRPTAMYGLAFSLCFLLCFLAFSYFVLLPWAIVKITKIFPKDTETKMGKTMLGGFLEGEKIDPEATDLVNHFYQNLKIHSSYQIHVTVVQSEVMNAFALPGGEIVVYSALLKSMKTYPELAALLGHETGHIEYRHSLRLLTQQLSVALVFGSIFQDYGAISAAVAGKAAELHQLSYSREAEEEADAFGYKSMQARRIDPHGMVLLFKRLKETGGDNNVPEFMMTHPSLDARIDQVEEKLKKDSSLHSVSKNDSLAFYWKEIKSLKSW